MTDLHHPQIEVTFAAPIRRVRGKPGGWEPIKTVSADALRIPIAARRPGLQSGTVRLSADGSLYGFGLGFQYGGGEIVIVSLETGQIVRRLEVGMGYGVGFAFLGSNALILREQDKFQTYVRAVDLASGKSTRHVIEGLYSDSPASEVVWNPEAGFVLLLTSDGRAQAFVEGGAGTRPQLLTYAATDVKDLVGASYEDGILQVHFARPAEQRERFHIGAHSGNPQAELIVGRSDAVLFGQETEHDADGRRRVRAPGSKRWAVTIDSSGAVARVDCLTGAFGPDRSVRCLDVQAVAVARGGRRAVAMDGRDSIVIDALDGRVLKRAPIPRIEWRDAGGDPDHWGITRRVGPDDDRWVLCPLASGWVAIDADCEFDPVGIPGRPCPGTSSGKQFAFLGHRELLVGELPDLRVIRLPGTPRGIVVCRGEVLAAIGSNCFRIDLLSGHVTLVGEIGQITTKPAMPAAQDGELDRSGVTGFDDLAALDAGHLTLQDDDSGRLSLRVADAGSTLVIVADGVESRVDFVMRKYKQIPLQPPVIVENEPIHDERLVSVGNHDMEWSTTLVLVAPPDVWSAPYDHDAGLDGLTLVLARSGHILRVDLSRHLDPMEARARPPLLPTKPLQQA